MESEKPINPWLSIWTKPRQTMRFIAQKNIKHRIYWLSAIYGFVYLLNFFRMGSFGQQTSAPMLLLIAVVLALPIGLVVYGIFSFFIYWSGKLVKGKASFKAVYSALCWSNVPNVVNGVIWLLLMAIFGSSLFIATYHGASMPGGPILLVLGLLVQLVMSIWIFVIFLHTLGEVQGFSAWMALLNVVLSWVAMSLVWGIIYFLVVKLIS